ncbi:MAG: hypothetical protein JST58_08625 [Bacteroidetes bacterium]|nr:hypothetical protein [Bacteroidota bacterium]
MKKSDIFLRMVWFPNSLKGICFAVAIFLSLALFGQAPNNNIDISKISFSVPLQGSIINESFAQSGHSLLVPFKNANSNSPNTLLGQPKKIIGKPVYLLFSLYNSSDSVKKCYFFPGVYFTDLQIYQKGSSGKPSLDIKNSIEIFSNGYASIQLQANEHADFIAKLTPLRSGNSILAAEIINKDFIGYFQKDISQSPIILVTYFVTGVLLMMLIYSVTMYLQDPKSAFLFYSLYLFFTGLLLFLKAYLYNQSLGINYYFEGCFDFILQGTGLIFYIRFIRTLFQTAKEHPFPEIILRSSQWITALLLCTFLLTYFLSQTFVIPDKIESATKLFLMALSIYLIFYWFPRKNKLINFLICGQSLLILFSIISYKMIITDPSQPFNSLFSDPTLYLEAGIVFELLFFLLILVNKNKKEMIEHENESRKLKFENEKKELEKQIAIMEAKSEERNRIAADMHDDLGGGVTAIRMMSEIAKTKIQKEAFPEIEKISHAANELHEKMNTIIWTINSSNDTLENLLCYIRDYAIDFFDKTNIHCHISIPRTLPNINLTSEKRRGIFLSVKESLNNILKHSKANTVQIIAGVKDKLTIEIYDNGKGIDLENLRMFGNGLSSMKKRMEALQGSLCIDNQNGTKLIFSVAI